jgi:DNA primase
LSISLKLFGLRRRGTEVSNPHSLQGRVYERVVNLGCIDLNSHPVRADDLEHPDELRVDLDPRRLG